MGDHTKKGKRGQFATAPILPACAHPSTLVRGDTNFAGWMHLYPQPGSDWAHSAEVDLWRAPGRRRWVDVDLRRWLL